MKKKFAAVFAVLFFACLLRSSATESQKIPGFPPPQADWPTFTGRIIRDESVPQDTPFPEVQVYARQYLENGGSAGVHMLTLVPGEDGVFVFERPSELMDIYLKVSDLPDGIGVVEDALNREYGLDVLEQDFILSAAADLQVSMEADGSLEPYIDAYDAKGRRLNINSLGLKTGIGRWKDENAGLVEITGVVYLGSGEPVLKESFSLTLDLSNLSEEDRTLRLDYWGVTDGVGFDGYANNGKSCTPTPGDWNGNGSNEEVLYLLLAAAAVVVFWLCIRRKR